MHLLKAPENLVGAFDDMVCDVALMRYTDIGDGIAANQAVMTDETEHACQHLVATGTIMCVAKDNFVCFRTVDLARSEEHKSELQSLMRISYAVFCSKKTTQVQLRSSAKHK